MSIEQTLAEALRLVVREELAPLRESLEAATKERDALRQEVDSLWALLGGKPRPSERWQ